MLCHPEFFDLSPMVRVVGHGRNTGSLIDQRMFNTMTALSANMFNIHKFDILIMSQHITLKSQF